MQESPKNNPPSQKEEAEVQQVLVNFAAKVPVFSVLMPLLVKEGSLFETLTPREKKIYISAMLLTVAGCNEVPLADLRKSALMVSNSVQ